ncbi:MAG: hypothetical protein MUE30_12515 [Spirosomaceae bacterium]|jgi:hypothetical protein|nr:hypothetical protein [Spirosomataceae bacterium]
MKNLLFLFGYFAVSLSVAQSSLPTDHTEVDFQFTQSDRPVSIKGLHFQFRLLDSTGKRIVAVFEGATDIQQVSDFKIKVLVANAKIAHLPQGNYPYELLDTKDKMERLWQKGTFQIRNTVGVESKAVA